MMMEVLSAVEDLSILLETLDQDDKPLEVIASRFHKTFQNKAAPFKLGCTLYMMIKDDLLSLSSKLTAYYLLMDMYSSEPQASNPFLPCFVAAGQREGSDSRTTVERNFVTSLLSNFKEVRMPCCPHCQLSDHLSKTPMTFPTFDHA